MSTAQRQKVDPVKIRKTAMKRIEEMKETYQEYKAYADIASKAVESLEEDLAVKIAELRAQHVAAHQDSYDSLATATEKFVEINHELRERMVDHYVKTGEKVIDENLSVRVTTKLEYANSEAVEWAEVNAPIMIVKSVDKKAFESLPRVKDLEFVRVEETPVSVIKGI